MGQVSWRGCVRSPSLEIFKTQPWTRPGCCSGHRGWAKLSVEFPHCLCESVAWTSDKPCIESLWKSDQNWGRILSLLTMSFSSYPGCLIFWLREDYTSVLFVFLFFLSCSCCLSEKSGHRFSNDRRPDEIIMFGDQMLLQCQLVHLSIGPYMVKTMD